MADDIKISKSKAAVIVVDIQDFFAQSCYQGDRVLRNSTALALAANDLGVPVLATEQRPDVFGKTPEEIRKCLTMPPVNKTVFSACQVPSITTLLKKEKKSQMIVCGFETHICVQQTCLDALDKGFDVYLVHDACGAFTKELHEIGLKRCEIAGTIPASAESVIFELVGDASSPAFKKLLPLIKSLRAK